MTYLIKYKENRKEIIMKENKDLEVQTKFNDDPIDILCTDDTIVENIEKVEVEENSNENN